MPQSQARSLVAVFDTESQARQAARQMEAVGVSAEDIRIGDSIDALSSIRGEMREEAVEFVGGPTGPYPQSARRGFAIGTVVGAVAGLAIALPFAAIPMGDLPAGTRLLIVAVVGVAFGSFLGWFLGGAFGLERPEEPLAAARGATLAVPDSDAARRALVETGVLRVDVISPDGEPIGRFAADRPNPARTLGEIARHARDEPTRG